MSRRTVCRGLGTTHFGRYRPPVGRGPWHGRREEHYGKYLILTETACPEGVGARVPHDRALRADGSGVTPTPGVVHVGRQALYDRSGDAVGYELLFRRDAAAVTATERGAYATSQ